MAEESFQEKTEEPTPRKLKKAREEGQAARSADLSGAMLFMTGSILLLFVGREIAVALGRLTHQSADWMLLRDLEIPSATAVLWEVGKVAGGVVLPLLLGLAAISLLINLSQTRLVFSLKLIQPKLERINPVANFKNIFNVHALVGLAKELVKLVVVGAVAYIVLSSTWSSVLALVGAEPGVLLSRIHRLAFKLMWWIGGAYFCIGMLDFAYEHFKHRRRLRMSRQEIRDENKELEGDPEIKARIRQIQRQWARRRMLQAVPKADVVVRNPTERAVALKYDPATDIAPIVLAMGERKLAQKIIEIAKKHNIPMVENRTLAKALLSTAKVGKPIPPDLYIAVAEVLSEIYHRSGKRLM